MTPEQRAALAARLQQPDVSGLGEQQAAEALNVAGTGTGSPVWQDIPSALVKRHLALMDAAVTTSPSTAPSLWGLIIINARRTAATAFTLTAGVPLAASNPNAQDRMVAQMAALTVWLSEFETIEATAAAVRARFGAIFDVLVTGGWMTTTDRDTIVALAQRPPAWWESAGLAAPLTARDVGLARVGGG